jgi:hypothetical protein
VQVQVVSIGCKIVPILIINIILCVVFRTGLALQPVPLVILSELVVRPVLGPQRLVLVAASSLRPVIAVPFGARLGPWLVLLRVFVLRIISVAAFRIARERNAVMMVAAVLAVLVRTKKITVFPANALAPAPAPERLLVAAR